MDEHDDVMELIGEHDQTHIHTRTHVCITYVLHTTHTNTHNNTQPRTHTSHTQTTQHTHTHIHTHKDGPDEAVLDQGEIAEVCVIYAHIHKHTQAQTQILKHTHKHTSTHRHA